MAHALHRHYQRIVAIAFAPTPTGDFFGGHFGRDGAGRAVDTSLGLVERRASAPGHALLGHHGLVLSLALNASPFMRFDGYFIASDLLDFPNLHERSGAIARAWLRRKLLGWKEPDPEPVTPRQRRALVVFALFTWLYRLVVFAGIAVAVYLMFFKVLGIFLLLWK